MPKVLMKGNEAIGLAAVLGGCDAFYGYPITPQNEIPEYLSKYMIEHNKVFVQAESEVAAINMVYGAAGAGKRVMTSSSSPGIALKQEGISYITGAELPCLIVSVMRGGPGLGGIQPSQADYYQATRGGGNGDYHVIVFAPETIQETIDIIKESFDIADYYRNPVMVLVDGLLGQMMESVDLNKPIKKRFLPPKDWATNGMKNHSGRNVVSSLNIDPQKLENHNLKLQAKYQNVIKNETRFECINMEKAEYVIVAYGTMSRIVRSALEVLKEKGINVGLIRPISLWPFPKEAFKQIPSNIKGILCTEMSLGQMLDDVLIANNGKHPVGFFGRTGGMIPEVEEVVRAIERFQETVVK
ncbi:MAG: 3-methyl-2-oxobutanoate dehydrogenase subunit VorB [Candidatus Izemoplasmatales bacterium]|jgi:2-oxoglutarate ferredoxin oxidoreductase subunit alpha|nr:3-methyl-2-oxobutanoate dehydrogenase subunit VorB [bacterium]MDZ4195692.1 3-methyl-2-oxobutanoate dehydrogenase subunit VorB [Candidatus Izemoplasmatales bacterium]